MQGDQRHTALQGGHGPGALNPCPIGGLALEGGNPLSCMHQPALGRGHPAVPVSPGHVRPLHPYPPSRRRRR
jgi:hypothetical protein